jgi:hypothetical protein
MKTYEIDVHLADAVHPARGKVFQLDSEANIGLWNRTSRKIENVLVTWKFHHLPAGLTPVITFESTEVIASGPTTVLGPVPKITFEIKFPRSVKVGHQQHVRYRITASRATMAEDAIPSPAEPTLVIDRGVDPPGGKGAGHPDGPHAPG